MYAPTMLDYQRQLIIANFDDFSPNAVFPEYCGGQYGSFHDEWGRRVIDFLCVNVQCNFIEPINFSDLLGNRGGFVEKSSRMSRTVRMLVKMLFGMPSILVGRSDLPLS